MAGARSPPIARRWSACTCFAKTPIAWRTHASRPRAHLRPPSSNACSRRLRSCRRSSNQRPPPVPRLTVRYLVLSDIHANLQALQAVVADASAIGYDAVVCLGDLVGYGANPHEVIQEFLALGPVATVRGNHDKVCAGLEPPT